MFDATCVLTGDLIRASGATDDHVEKTFDVLKLVFENMKSWWHPHTPPRFTRFRGDGWHAIAPSPERALTAAIYLHSSLRGTGNCLATRVSIGVGDITYLGTKDLSDARGSAFAHSGRGLDEMSRSQWLAISGDGVTQLHRAICLLIGERVTRWTSEQSNATALALDPDVKTQAEIAERLGITTQAANARLSAAGFQTIRQALDLWAESFDQRGSDP